MRQGGSEKRTDGPEQYGRTKQKKKGEGDTDMSLMYTEEQKALGRRTSFFPKIYWCLVTAIYLGISFYFSNWRISWIIWPVAGVLFAALNGIVQAVAGKAKR